MIYGIWIKGEGWLRGSKGVISFAECKVARDTARRVGGKVRFIDDSLQDLESKLLMIEFEKNAKKWWQFWRK